MLSQTEVYKFLGGIIITQEALNDVPHSVFQSEPSISIIVIWQTIRIYVYSIRESSHHGLRVVIYSQSLLNKYLYYVNEFKRLFKKEIDQLMNIGTHHYK